MSRHFNKLLFALCLLIFVVCPRISANEPEPDVKEPKLGIIPNRFLVQLKSSADLTTHTEFLRQSIENRGSANSVNGAQPITFSKPIVWNLNESVVAINSISAQEAEQDVSQFDKEFVSYVIDNPPADLVQTLAKRQEVEVIEPDQLASSFQTNGRPRLWNLDRIDSRELAFDFRFRFPLKAGEGVKVYVLDTGINPNHQEFTDNNGTKRATLGPVFGVSVPSSNDDEGHGSHVASTAAGRTFGVAKKSQIIAIKVLGNDGTGSYSAIISGLNYVFEQVAADPNKGKAVVVMSLGGGVSKVLNSAVDKLYSSGNIVPVVAAGNSGADACKTSPASADGALTVGAIDFTDTRASFSNWGSCVNVFAPGTAIFGANYKQNNGGTTMAGTSMAAPLVGGIAAVYMSTYPALTSQQITKLLLQSATKGLVKNIVPNQRQSVGDNTTVLDGTEQVIPLSRRFSKRKFDADNNRIVYSFPNDRLVMDL